MKKVAVLLFLFMPSRILAEPSPSNYIGAKDEERAHSYLEKRCALEPSLRRHGELISLLPQSPPSVNAAIHEEVTSRKKMKNRDAELWRAFGDDYKFYSQAWRIKPSEGNLEWLVADVTVVGRNKQGGYFYHRFTIGVDPRSGKRAVFIDGGLGVSDAPIESANLLPDATVVGEDAVLAPWDVVDIFGDGRNEIILSSKDSTNKVWGLDAYRLEESSWKNISSACKPTED